MMRLFDLPHAKHFCVPAPAVAAIISLQSLPAFHASLTKSVTRMQEGTIRFQIHQINVLNSVDRWLLYSVVHYRRSVDMLAPASAPWAQVTLYYASFYAANAILGMFGGWIGHTADGSRIVDVENGTPGAQELRIYRRLPSPNVAKGSHRAFWDFFYDSAATISAWAPAHLAAALTPVNGDFAWQIAERNNVNYDMYEAWASSLLLFGGFKPAKLKSLSGPIKLQLDSTEALIKLALHFAAAMKLSTAALVGCGPTGTTAQIRKRLASQHPPTLVTQSAFSSLA